MRIFKKFSEKIINNDIQKILTTIFSQGMLSLTNFLVGILIAKYATKEEYGVFVVFFSFIGVMSGFHNALISSPLMVLAGQKPDSERNAYVVSLTIGRNYFFLPLLLLFSIVLVLYNQFMLHDGRYMLLSLFISIPIMMYTAKEFQRTVHFTLLNTNTIFFMDLTMMITVFAGVYLLVFVDKVNALSGLLVLSMGYTFSYVYAKLKNPYKDRSRLIVKEAIRENWRYGRWLIMGIFSSMFQDRSYIYITTILLGLGALADVSATRLFMMPIMLLSGSVIKIMVAKGSLMVSRDEHKKFRKFLLYFMIALTSVWLVYVVVIMLLSDTLIGFLGEKYRNTENLIILWGVYVLIMTLKSMLTTGIIVYKRFKQQAVFDLLGAITVIISCVLFISLMGRPGAIISLIIGESLIMSMYIYLFYKITCETDASLLQTRLRETGALS